MVGTQVWLEGTHLRLPYQATKLAPKRYGPFEITKEISPIAYQLHLPIGWNIHDVFHALLLSPYREGPLPLKGLRGKNDHRFSAKHTPSSPTKRYKGYWGQTPPSLVSWPKYEEVPYPPDQHEMLSKGTQTSTLQYLGESSMPWQKPLEGWRII